MLRDEVIREAQYYEKLNADAPVKEYKLSELKERESKDVHTVH